MSGSAKSKVDDMLVQAGAGGYVVATGFMVITFSMTYFVNTAGLVVGFLAAGKFRESVFGSHSNAHPTVVACLQFCAGPCFVNIVHVSLWITFLLQLIFSYVFLLVWILLITLTGICASGSAAIDAAKTLTEQVQQSGEDPGGIGDLSIDKFCSAGGALAWSGLLLCIGCIITVVSQAGMLSTLAMNKERIAAERDHAREPALRAEETEMPTSYIQQD